MVRVSWFTSDQSLIGKMAIPSVLTHTHNEAHCLLPALWIINFPDRACPTIKCSPPFLCRTQSVPPLSCVSAEPGSFQFPWPLITLAQNVRPKNITLYNLCLCLSLYFSYMYIFFIWFGRYISEFFSTTKSRDCPGPCSSHSF